MTAMTAMTARSTIQKWFTLFSFMSLSVFCNVHSAFAGGCKMEEVSVAAEFASKFIAGKVRDKMLAIEKEMKSKGQTLELAIVSRGGNLINDFYTVKDQPEIPLDQYMERLSKVVKKDGEQGPLRVPVSLRSEHKLKYTHSGFYLRDSKIEANENNNDLITMVHLLSECDEKSERYGDSQIFHEVLSRFFWETADREEDQGEEVLIMVPGAKAQKRIYEILTNRFLPRLVSQNCKKDTVGMRLHNPNYNAISMPFQTFDQNSNQWPLEVIAASQVKLGSVTMRSQAQAILKGQNYRPSIVQPDSFKASIACNNVDGVFNLGLFYDATNVIDCDHQIYRESNLYQIITVDSLKKYMLRNGLLKSEDIYELSISAEEVNK